MNDNYIYTLSRGRRSTDFGPCEIRKYHVLSQKTSENSYLATEFTDSIKNLENEHRILKQQLKGKRNTISLSALDRPVGPNQTSGLDLINCTRVVDS